MPGSDIVTEDDVIRKRLLMDGEGSGEEKRVVNLLKTFVKWVKEPNSDEATFQKACFVTETDRELVILLKLLGIIQLHYM